MILKNYYETATTERHADDNIRCHRLDQKLVEKLCRREVRKASQHLKELEKHPVRRIVTQLFFQPARTDFLSADGNLFGQIITQTLRHPPQPDRKRVQGENFLLAKRRSLSVPWVVALERTTGVFRRIHTAGVF